MKMIKELWRGNLQPITKFGNGVSGIAELKHLKEHNRTRLFNLLGDENKETLEKYTECIEECTNTTCEQAIYEGFCLGVRISNESLACAEEITKRDCCL